MKAAIPSTELRLELPDGRTLGYALYGATDATAAGATIVLLHGTPGSRRIVAVTDRDASARGLRIVAPDRPGCGLSSPLPGRTLLDWPDDVARLLDALGVERGVVGGISGGGPYAAACALRLADRFSGLGLIAAMGPVADAPVELTVATRTLYAAARAAPWMIHGVFALAAFALERSPRLLPRRISTASDDRRLLGRRDVRHALREDIREAFRQGAAGAARDIELFLQPWGFAPEEIELPARLWHGEADSIVPAAIARGLAARLPRCDAQFIPDAGHFWMFDRVDSILDGLAALADAAPASRPTTR